MECEEWKDFPGLLMVGDEGQRKRLRHWRRGIYPAIKTSNVKRGLSSNVHTDVSLACCRLFSLFSL